MRLAFVTPVLLGLMPIGIALVVWSQRTGYVRASTTRSRVMLALRVALVAVLSLALARPYFTGASTQATTVFLVDVSRSIPDRTLEAARALVNDAWAARGAQEVEIVTFGAHARRATPAVGAVPTLERHDEEASNLAEAITFGRGLLIDRAPHFVLISDGNQTRGDVEQALASAVAAGAQLDVARVGNVPSDAAVRGLRLPDALHRQETARIGVTVNATRGGRAAVRLEENTLLIEERAVELRVGTQDVDFTINPGLTGQVKYSAAVRMPGDEVPGNDRFSQLVFVNGPPRVLLAAATPEEGVHLEEALAAQEIGVESISPGSLPSSLEGLLGYDEVILAGVAPFELDGLRQRALASYVRDTGGGLVFVSGQRGLRRDPDGHANALEPILPVELAAPSERQEPPIAIVLLVDRSGSMVGEKLGYAKQAALAVIDRLTAHDQVGVIAFDASFDWAVALSPLTDKEPVKAAVGSLGAGGGTRFYPALEEAYFALGSADVALRHAILLTDGVSTDPDIFADLLAKASTRGITVSTVAIGNEADTKLLTRIAKLGGGRYTQAATASQVPQIFLKETETVQKDAAQRAETSVRVRTAARELNGIDFRTAPPILGYLRTKAKGSTAEVLLETDHHDPLLVRWRYGLGTVVAYTSDATGLWSQEWLTRKWPGFGLLWSQVVRGTQRTRSRHDLSLTVTPRLERLELRVEAIDASGRFLNDLEVKVRVVESEHPAREVALEQTSPGHYTGEIEDDGGSVLASPSASVGGRRLDGAWVVVPRPYPPELSDIGPNDRFLDRLQQLGHGRRVAATADLATVPRLPRRVPLTLPFGVLALALFLADVFAKRSRWEVRQ